jgi:hypothetical protein
MNIIVFPSGLAAAVPCGSCVLRHSLIFRQKFYYFLMKKQLSV